MKALSVYLGGFKICTAGAGDAGSTTAQVSINFGPDEKLIILRVGGFEGTNGVMLNWCKRILRVGDEIRIIVEETKEIDRPIERITHKELQERTRNLGKKS